MPPPVSLLETDVADAPKFSSKKFAHLSFDRKSNTFIEINLTFTIFLNFRRMEMTASPDLSLGESIKQDVAVEASRAEEYHQYQIAGLMAHHFAERALPLLGSSNPITIVRLDPVTVTVSQTVTSKFPFDKPSDRVTLAYAGCVPSDVVAMNLPHCF